MTVRIRRLAAVGTALALTAGISACGAVDSPTAGGNGGTGKELRIAALSDHPYIKDEAKRFQEQNPDLKVSFVQAPSNTYQATIRSQLSAGHGPDVMFVWSGSGNSMATKTLASSDLLANLTKSPWVDQQPPQGLDLVKQDGEVYALNTFQNPTGIVYDTAKMSQLGVKPPSTFSGLLNFCKTVAGKGIVPIAMGNQTGYLNIEIPLELANSLIYSKDPQFGEKAAAGKIDWATDKLWNDSLRTGLTKYMQMNDAKCFQPNTTGFSDQQAIALVASGKALGVDVIASSYPSILSANGDKSYDMFELPATENPDDTWLTTNPGSAFAVNAKSGNLKAAVEFINYLGAPEQVSRDAKAYFGLPYVVDQNAKIPSEFASVESLYKAKKTALWATNYWPNPQVKQTMIAQDQNLILGKASVDDVISAMNKSYGSN